MHVCECCLSITNGRESLRFVSTRRAKNLLKISVFDISVCVWIDGGRFDRLYLKINENTKNWKEQKKVCAVLLPCLEMSLSATKSLKGYKKKKTMPTKKGSKYCRFSRRRKKNPIVKRDKSEFCAPLEDDRAVLGRRHELLAAGR